MSIIDKVVREALERGVGDQNLAASGVLPEHVTAVVQYLNLNGYVLVPKTIIGIAGWTPKEEQAYQAGWIAAKHDKEVTYTVEEL